MFDGLVRSDEVDVWVDLLPEPPFTEVFPPWALPPRIWVTPPVDCVRVLEDWLPPVFAPPDGRP